MCPRRSLALSALTAVAAALVGCASAGPTGAPAAPQVRTAPDDSDLLGVLPAGAETIMVADMDELRRSPWARPLFEASAPEERAARRERQGFDELADFQQVVFSVTEPAGGADAAPTTLIAGRGRFDADRIGRAFLASAPGATTSSWRGSPVWEHGGRALALITPRTLVSGPPALVRSAIDCAWGAAPDIRGDQRLGTVRRALAPERGRPAVLVTLTVTEGMRRRVGGSFEVPPGLQSLGARLDVGADLELALLGFMEDGAAAEAAARVLEERLRELRRQRMLRILGISQLLDGADLAAQGARVQARLHIPEARREDLRQKLMLLFQMVSAGRAPGLVP